VAIVVGSDNYGVYATVECDRRGCFGHVSIRPAEIGSWHGYDLVCEAFDQAEAAGWRMVGRTYCPRHAIERLRRRVRLGDGFAWAWTASEGVKGGQRPA
jgi:hypothetical protein